MRIDSLVRHLTGFGKRRSIEGDEENAIPNNNEKTEPISDNWEEMFLKRWFFKSGKDF